MEEDIKDMQMAEAVGCVLQICSHSTAAEAQQTAEKGIPGMKCRERGSQLPVPTTKEKRSVDSAYSVM